MGLFMNAKQNKNWKQCKCSSITRYTDFAIDKDMNKHQNHNYEFEKVAEEYALGVSLKTTEIEHIYSNNMMKSREKTNTFKLLVLRGDRTHERIQIHDVCLWNFGHKDIYLFISNIYFYKDSVECNQDLKRKN